MRQATASPVLKEKSIAIISPEKRKAVLGSLLIPIHGMIVAYKRDCAQLRLQNVKATFWKYAF